jgi:hypothetical protein
MKRAMIPLLVILGLVCCGGRTQGAIITIAIEGVVDHVGDPDNYLNGMVNVGDLITGTYAYDTDTPDSSPLSGAGRYEHYGYPSGFSLSVGGLDFVTDPANTNFLIEIVNNYPYDDGYGVVSYNNFPLSNGTKVNNISWALRDDSASAISGVDLTATAPVLHDWEHNLLLIGGVDRKGFLITGYVTSTVVIPEPSAMLLLGFGAIGLIRRVKK